jgi:hypothetical protein
LRKSAGTGTSIIAIFLANSGAVDAQSGTIRVSSGSDWDGRFQAESGGAIYFYSGSYLVSGPLDFRGPGPVGVNGSVVINGTLASPLNWYSGTLLAGSGLGVGTNGVLNLLGSLTVYGGLTNAGVVNQQAASVTVRTNASVATYQGVIWNQAGGLWDIQGDWGVNDYYGGERFYNAGTLRKSAGTGTSIIAIFLANSGTVDAQSGTIRVSSGSDWGGRFQAESGAAIYFYSGNYSVSGSLDFRGPGSVGVNGSVVINGTLASPLNWYSGTLLAGSGLGVGTSGVLNLLGSITVTGGLTNSGVVNQQAASVTVAGTATDLAVIWNQAGGLWDIHGDWGVNDYYGGEEFYNAGTLRKSAGTGTSTIGIYLVNSGTVSAQQGLMNFTGIFTETSSARLAIGIGGAAPGSGYGRMQFSSATFAGSFKVIMLNGFQPTVGNAFTVLTYPAPFPGGFGNMNGLDMGNALWLAPGFGQTALTLTAMPYPTTLTPIMRIAPTPGGVLVWWPDNFAGWQLEMATNLIARDWTPVTLNGTDNNIIVPRATSQGYFRLRQ